jgi:hypothetical protein
MSQFLIYDIEGSEYPMVEYSLDKDISDFEYFEVKNVLYKRIYRVLQYRDSSNLNTETYTKIYTLRIGTFNQEVVKKIAREETGFTIE